MSKLIDLTGQRFGRLVVLERIYDSSRRGAKWRCQCDCGNETIALGYLINSGETKSCGCLRRELSSQRGKGHIGNTNGRKHNESNTKLYRRWRGIKDRCLNPNAKDYKDYGARNITVCDEWKNSYEAFRDWALANGYSKELSIDRIDNSKGYSPDNCRWVTAKVQNNNTRSNRFLEHCGQTKTMAQWGEYYKVDYRKLCYEMSKDISLEQAIKNCEER